VNFTKLAGEAPVYAKDIECAPPQTTLFSRACTGAPAAATQAACKSEEEAYDSKLSMVVMAACEQGASASGTQNPTIQNKVFFMVFGRIR
jgi:hypothetical protein